MAFTEDLSAFFSQADFAEAATLDGTAVSVIFNDSYDDYHGVVQHDAWAKLPSSQAAAVTQASVFVCRGVTYRVRVPRPDGSGVTVLYLERQ